MVPRSIVLHDFRLRHHDIVLRALTADARGFSERSAWQVVDVTQHLLNFVWQSASVQRNDGYLNVSGGLLPVQVSGRYEQDQLTQLLITVENSVPWLILITN